MVLKRIILEMGHGNDMHGGDYTKAAIRAVQDCIHHSSLPFLRTLNITPSEMQIEVTIGVQEPEKVDTTAVAKSLPHGQVTVKVVREGLTYRMTSAAEHQSLPPQRWQSAYLFQFDNP